jgi:serine/threonine protein kinase
MPVEIGNVVGDKYVLGRLIGRGSMGEVWMATHRSLEQRVAIKFLTPDDQMAKEGDALQRRFLFEAQIAARLSRETAHVVSVTDYGVEGGVAYLVMELLEGADIETILERSGPLPLATARTIVAHAALGLSVAHSDGVLHRDLKTANLFLTRDERGNPWLKILDFGLARSMHRPRLTAQGMVMGNAAFMSPEQAINHPGLDARCDLWALSVATFEALTGALPFEPDPPEEWLRRARSGVAPSVWRWRPELPAGVDAFFRRAFAPNIDERFATAASLSSAFDDAVRSTDTLTPSPVVGSRRFAQRLVSEGEGRVAPPRFVTALALLVIGGLAMTVTVTRARFKAVDPRSPIVAAALQSSPPLLPPITPVHETETPEMPSSAPALASPMKATAPPPLARARTAPVARSSSDAGAASVATTAEPAASPTAQSSRSPVAEDLGYGDRK